MNQERYDFAMEIAELVAGATAPLQAWGPYFLNKKNREDDQRLAAQAFSVYFVSLYDVSDLRLPNRLPRIEKKVRDRGHHDLGLNCQIFCSKSEFATRILAQVPEELQIVVRYFRDRWVHGPLANYSNDTVKVRIETRAGFKTLQFERKEFQLRIKRQIEQWGGPGPALSDAMQKSLIDSDWFAEIREKFVDPIDLAKAMESGAIALPFADRRG